MLFTDVRFCSLLYSRGELNVALVALLKNISLFQNSIRQAFPSSPSTGSNKLLLLLLLSLWFMLCSSTSFQSIIVFMRQLNIIALVAFLTNRFLSQKPLSNSCFHIFQWGAATAQHKLPHNFQVFFISQNCLHWNVQSCVYAKLWPLAFAKQ